MINCKFENGNEVGLRHVVADALAVKNDKIVLVKRSKKLIEGGKWAIPGGYVDRGEKLESAALRELKEETGLDGEIISLIKIIDDTGTEKDDRQNVKFIYEVSPSGELSGDEESEVVKWFALNQLPSKEEFAFDHFEIIEEFLQEKKK